MGQIQVADLIKRFGVDSVCVAPGGDHNSACAVQGHWVYVRKLVPKDPEFIILPDKSKDQCNSFKVLAKGVRVGKRREEPKDKRKRDKIPLRITDALEVGSVVLIKDDVLIDRIRRSPYDEERELLIDEYCIEAVVEE